MQVMLVSMVAPVGEPERSLMLHRELLKLAKREGCALAVFPEMSLTGYVAPAHGQGMPVALDCRQVLALLGATVETGVAALFGIAEANPGKKPFVTQVFAAGGRVAGVYRKQHLGEDEGPHFAPGHGGGPWTFEGVTFGVAVCADSQVPDAFEQAAAAGASVVFLCSGPGLTGRRTDDASWRAGYDWWRGECLRLLPSYARQFGLTIATATLAGSTVVEDYPGGNMVIDPGGEVVLEGEDWHPTVVVIEVA
ncbi:MAG TPA: nitrilase-related carbon-nitrogen hydrolase [Tepidiformaceae bacterium]